MAGTSLLALIDDIATLLDDVTVMTKVAAQKTAGVLGDDLALNAQQVTGVNADRELPVVWAVFKGSALNKAILVPAALAISAVAPWAITPMLMAGGAFLCFEGFEKVAEKFFHTPEEEVEEEHKHEALLKAVADPEIDMVEFEKRKVKGAIRTDFILSAEIIIIALGTVGEAALLKQVGVLVMIAIGMTIGVYGLVAGIVKLDDLGLYLVDRGPIAKKFGLLLLAGTPWLMKSLGVVGTIAMFLVGGGIIAHGIPFLAHWVHALTEIGGGVGAVGPHLFNAAVGIVTGGIIVAIYTLFHKIRGTSAH